MKKITQASPAPRLPSPDHLTGDARTLYDAMIRAIAKETLAPVLSGMSLGEIEESIRALLKAGYAELRTDGNRVWLQPTVQ